MDADQRGRPVGFLALDLSKRSTGYALWDRGWEKPIFGHWQLGSEYTSDGQTFTKLHRCMGDLFKIAAFEFLYYEEPITPAQLQGFTTIQTINLAVGLAAHAQSFGHAKRCRIIKAVNIETWRKYFIGTDLSNEAKAVARRKRKAGDNKASARDALKGLTIARCNQLGFDPRKDDEADAIGILDYALELNGIVPPWRSDEVLRPMMDVGTAR